MVGYIVLEHYHNGEVYDDEYTCTTEQAICLTEEKAKEFIAKHCTIKSEGCAEYEPEKGSGIERSFRIIDEDTYYGYKTIEYTIEEVEIYD